MVHARYGHQANWCELGKLAGFGESFSLPWPHCVVLHYFFTLYPGWSLQVWTFASFCLLRLAWKSVTILSFCFCLGLRFSLFDYCLFFVLYLRLKAALQHLQTDWVLYGQASRAISSR